MSKARELPDVRQLPDLREINAVMGWRGSDMRHTVVAKRIGVHTRTLRRAFMRGELPGAKEHGERILMIPASVFRLIEAYGLRGVARMVKAGRL